ncbi:glycosyltransferase family 2 protein [Paenibacillus sp. BR2-3]|uniref:glycosyltransferase family 2 protein n=1 Tax=Paenibacillus sp. BR2-3 TaxID=3048494 RepID=UPI0039779589
MEKYQVDVSIIIVNYNTKILTTNTIDSILKKTKGIEYEIIVVDNNSSDGSVEMFKELYEGDIILIESNENLGFGKANNVGIETSKGKYIFLLNSDTLLVNNAIKILFCFMETDQNIGVSGANLYDENNNPTHSFRLFLPSFNLTISLKEIVIKLFLKFIKKRRPDFNYSFTPKEVGYITGADMMIRKDVLIVCGMFDPDFFMYYEEAELTHRIKSKGYAVISVPKAKIIHIEGASTKVNKGYQDFNPKKYRMAIESMYKYFEKVYGNSSVNRIYVIRKIILILASFFRDNNHPINHKRRISNEEFIKWCKKMNIQ